MDTDRSSNTFLLALYVPNLYGGGAQRVMVTLANEFADRGLNVDLVVANFEGPYCNDVSENVHVVDLECSRAITSLPSLVRYLRHEQPAGLLSTLMYANVIAACAHFLSGSNANIILREATHVSASSRLDCSIKHKIIRKLAVWSYKYADDVISLTKNGAKDICKVFNLPSQKVTTIHNPAFRSDIRRLQKTLPIELESSQNYITAVGRLSSEKDFSTLLRAFALIRESRSGTKLVILGEGNQRDYLETMARSLSIWEEVYMPGFVDNPFGYMSVADVFVLSSRWEGFGNVLVEAMACGTPVVSTDCPSGPTEILKDERWGYLVPVGDHEALAHAILNTLDNPPVSSEELIERAKDFAPEEIAEEYLNVIKNGAA